MKTAKTWSVKTKKVLTMGKGEDFVQDDSSAEGQKEEAVQNRAEFHRFDCVEKDNEGHTTKLQQDVQGLSQKYKNRTNVKNEAY